MPVLSFFVNKYYTNQGNILGMSSFESFLISLFLFVYLKILYIRVTFKAVNNEYHNTNDVFFF